MATRYFRRFSLRGQLPGLFALLIFSNLAGAQTIGVVTHLSGVLTVRHEDGSTVLLAVKSPIRQGDTLTTEADTFTRVKFVDNEEIVLRPNSQLLIKTYRYDAGQPELNRIAMQLHKGGVRTAVGLIGKRDHDAVSFDTPNGTISIRGTNFGALFCQNDCGSVPTRSGSTPQNGLYVDVAQGAVVVTNPAGQQVYQAGQFGFVASLNTPPTVIPPAQGVPVTMPLSISKNAPANQ